MIPECRGDGSSACVEVRERAILAAASAIKAGDLVVFPTDTVYGIGADPFNPAAVQRLLDAKGRGRGQPSPVLAASSAQAFALARTVPEGAMQLAKAYWPGALTLILRVNPELNLDLGDKPETIALRVPALPFALRLLAATGPLAVSSANLNGQPAATTSAAAAKMLGDTVAIYLDGGATPSTPSTIVDFATTPKGRVIRTGAIGLASLRALWPDLEGSDA
ncbi:MAG: threonylcarbamoyl-AMP synthase [Propionibacteriaceae bacterium]|jgi:tRNA threonylcarbamoyl adenosine modification protein (Sua5/YciO/YrdC/YwlC family)|nr:threonylcarbamoyl-AMP synthase [Propionibacteriaceae bacterium]